MESMNEITREPRWIHELKIVAISLVIIFGTFLGGMALQL